MKRYNLSEIMRTAHRTYKYVGKKQGKTFGEVLKSTWRLAKLDVARQEADAKRKAEEGKRLESLKNSRTGYGQYVLSGLGISVHCTDSEIWDWCDDDENEDKHLAAKESAYRLLVNSL